MDCAEPGTFHSDCHQSNDDKSENDGVFASTNVESTYEWNGEGNDGEVREHVQRGLGILYSE